MSFLSSDKVNLTRAMLFPRYEYTRSMLGFPRNSGQSINIIEALLLGVGVLHDTKVLYRLTSALVLDIYSYWKLYRKPILMNQETKQVLAFAFHEIKEEDADATKSEFKTNIGSSLDLPKQTLNTPQVKKMISDIAPKI